MGNSNSESFEGGAFSAGASQTTAARLYESAYTDVKSAVSSPASERSISSTDTSRATSSGLGLPDLSFTGLDSGTSGSRDAATAERSRAATPSKKDPLEAAKSGSPSGNDEFPDKSSPNENERDIPRRDPQEAPPNGPRIVLGNTGRAASQIT